MPQRADGEFYDPATDVVRVPPGLLEGLPIVLSKAAAERAALVTMRWLAEVVDEGPPGTPPGSK